jgi:predicted protein tyrosine phosphatase
MTLPRIRFWLLFLATCVGALLFLWGLDWWYREEPTYSLIEDGLYLGGALTEPPPGTQAVLNLCEVEDTYRCDTHVWKPIRDAAPAPSIDWLREQVEFVDSQRRAGNTVYIHCFAGISRSGMVVIAYLMLKNHWTVNEALAFVRSKRPIVRPNPAFMKLLCQWECELEGRTAVASHALCAILPDCFTWSHCSGVYRTSRAWLPL